jgi:hypothetical protein
MVPIETEPARISNIRPAQIDPLAPDAAMAELLGMVVESRKRIGINAINANVNTKLAAIQVRRES